MLAPALVTRFKGVACNTGSSVGGQAPVEYAAPRIDAYIILCFKLDSVVAVAIV